jgi:hypothetical protein
MTEVVLLRNRHPADELADVRAEIKQLQIKEVKLRSRLLADDADRIGMEYEAVIRDGGQNRLNISAVIAHFGADALKPFYRKVACQIVMLKRVAHNGARNGDTNA